MRVTKEKAAEHRERMLYAASRLFRERGFDGVGIPEIARAADLTHGAFYTHFKSKDALCAEALGCAIDQKLEPLARAGAGPGALKMFVNYYLSEPQVTRFGEGCPIAGLGGETARQPKAVRSAFERALKRFVGAVAPLFSAKAAKREHQKTLAAIAMLVGGVILARAVEDDAYRSEILDAVRHAALDAAE
ncbi:MAG: hypothetical protein A4S14_19330 [Proteobacteria bacterium SG_bin9]|nr:MAG: hypothetical protein A4S14_19330 [Proteobacteria bacterium SG_bin9]